MYSFQNVRIGPAYQKMQLHPDFELFVHVCSMHHSEWINMLYSEAACASDASIGGGLKLWCSVISRV